jgi:hypothetical protein
MESRDSARPALRREIVAKHRRFQLELTETVLHHVSDGDDAEEMSVLANDEVPKALAGHPLHDGFDAVVRIAKRGGSHDILDEHVADRPEVAIHRFHDVSFADESDDGTISRDDRHAADVVNEE